MPGLGTSFGRGGATTAQQDLANADCILIQGSSMAEAHPVGFRWVLAAKERGATVIHVDPRYSRTSALADIWVPIRAGADIVFLGGLIRYVLANELYFKEYVARYTNASCIVRDDYRDAEELGGLFSGWDDESRTYDRASWGYVGTSARPDRDETLSHPNCVFQILRRHFERYTPEMVEEAAGVPREVFLRVAEAFTRASGPEKTAAICYAVGWTQHSKGVQIIRAAAILQLLLGNIGRPGGGIMALRGHASIQGSTDIPTLYDILPGYLPMPRTDDVTLADYLRRNGRTSGWWSFMPAYITSLLKAYYGNHATPDNDFGWHLMPRVTANHSHFAYFTEMADGRVEGLFVMGQNPAVGAQHSRFERKALSRLKWLVVRDMVEIETASFWYGSPEIRRGELATDDIQTEVFLFPAAGHAEKEGSFTQTQRMLQWREKAVHPPGDARSEAWFIHQLAKRLKAKAEQERLPRDDALRALDWWYPEDEHGEPRIESVLAEINGWHVDAPPDAAHREGVSFGLDRNGHPHHGTQVKGFTELKDDGSTACGCWIYSGVLGPDGVNRALRREPKGPLAHGWGWAWPADRRILYNRASAAPDGAPWSDAKKLVWWEPVTGRWTGDDVPDFLADRSPDYRPAPDSTGMDAHGGDAPFILQEDGLGQLFVPGAVLADGPLPTHYEPLESPVPNALYPQQRNPAVNWFPRADNRFAPSAGARFPHVLTTYRLTEHHTAGGMSRFLSHLAELQPELFAEISPELAADVGVENGDWITVATPRAVVEARALVTRRIRPVRVGGRVIHQVAMPFHWGSAGPVRGDVVNDLIPLSGEPNVTIHEGKALTCSVRKGRRPSDEHLAAWLEELGASGSPGPASGDARAQGGSEPSKEVTPHDDRPGGGAQGHHGKTPS